MDADHFDALSRILSSSPSRRGFLAALIGSVLGVSSSAVANAAKSGKCQTRCGECEQCQKGNCHRKHGRKRCKKGTCVPNAAGTPCTTVPNGVCQAGSCFPRSTCPATITTYCGEPIATLCGASGTAACFCGRSAEGNVVCLLDEDELCLGSSPLCTTSADCPSGEACVNVAGCCSGDPSGSKRCMAPCPFPD